jgi:hypothetical protein
MVDARKVGMGTERKIFDPRDVSTGSGGAEVLDPTVVQRGEQWWMFLAGQTDGYGATEIYSASLAVGAPLSDGLEPHSGSGGRTRANRRTEI